MKNLLVALTFLLVPAITSAGPLDDIVKTVTVAASEKVKSQSDKKEEDADCKDEKCTKDKKDCCWKDTLPATNDVPAYLQDISVTIRTNRGTGSGVVKTRIGADGQKHTFIWTAGHVIDSLRKTRQVIDPASGTQRTIVEFDDPKVVKEIFENGRNVGRLELDAEVIRFSDADNGEDLALLRLRKKNFIDSSVVFYLDEEIPSIGTHVLHVGSLLGQMGANSLTDGIVSQHGRLINKKIYDQTTAPAFPGSSGGGVFLDNGAYIGMLVRGAGETFCLTVPVRRMKGWAEKAKVMWALDDNVPIPNEEDLFKLPIEDVGKSWQARLAAAAAEKSPYQNYPTFLHVEKSEVKTKINPFSSK